jgi:hypothetical protein
VRFFEALTVTNLPTAHQHRPDSQVGWLIGINDIEESTDALDQIDPPPTESYAYGALGHPSCSEI